MIRAVVVVGALSATVYGAVYGYQRALTSPALSIQSVRLHQVPNVLIEPVRARLKPAYGQNLLALDLRALRTSIEELPSVRSAGIRRVLPGGLVVSIEARTPRALIVTEQATYVIDSEGIVLDAIDPRMSRIPEIRLPDTPQLAIAPGKRLTALAECGRQVTAALAVLDWLDTSEKPFTRPVSHLRIDTTGVVVVAAPGVLEVVVGDALDMDSKMEAVRSLLNANPPSEPSTIDARFADMLVVRALPTESG
jgi:hypothetical protein